VGYGYILYTVYRKSQHLFKKIFHFFIPNIFNYFTEDCKIILSKNLRNYSFINSFCVVTINKIKIEISEFAKLFFGTFGGFDCLDNFAEISCDRARHIAFIIKIE